MKIASIRTMGISGARALALVGLLWAGTGVTGCVVREERAYYYRTRVVYTPDGPLYLRERVYYYDPPPPVVVETPVPAAPAPAPAPPSAAASLHPLVASIALYPDPLIAVILPACTFPQQLQEAQTWLSASPQPTQEAIDAQPWEPSIKALVHYPTVLAQLTADMRWSQSLGAAFSAQPADVMAAVQDMRAEALAQGNLVNTPQQVIVQDAGVIAIEPASPEIIYVPTYDPVEVYVAWHHPVFFNGVFFATGPWLVNGVYWGGGAIFVGDWHGGYYFHGGHWGRDYAWRFETARRWERGPHFGPAPRIDRAHYELARDVRGRQAEIHRTMIAHEAARREIQRGGRR